MVAGSRPFQPQRVAVAAAALFSALALVATAVVPASAVEPEDAEPVLYLTQRPFEAEADQWNFTAFPADQDETGGRRQASQQGTPTFVAIWSWWLTRAPANWTVSEGDEWEFNLFIGGLDEVYPVPEITIPPSLDLVGHEIRVEIYTSEEVTASGSILVPFQEVEEGINEYTVSVAFNNSQEFVVDEAPDRFRIDVAVTGRGQDPESPLRLHFGSADHSSRLLAPSYPHEEFRSRELVYLLEQECKDLILQQKSCEGLKRPGDEEDEEEAEATVNGTDPEDVANANGPGTQASGNTTDHDDDPTTRVTPGPGLLLPMLIGLTACRLLRRSCRTRASGAKAGAT